MDIDIEKCIDIKIIINFLGIVPNWRNTKILHTKDCFQKLYKLNSFIHSPQKSVKAPVVKNYYVHSWNQNDSLFVGNFNFENLSEFF